MTQEQKAKAYDEALEKAKSMIDDLRKGEDILAVSDLESMFPELKESEDNEDERIRKVLVSIVKWFGFDSLFFTDNSVTKSEVLAYLEKQKDSVSNAKYIEDVAHAFEDGRKKGIEEKQKEQKPAEWSKDDKFKLEDAITGIDVGIGFYETEGKHPNLLKAIIEAKEWLKSLCPQPHTVSIKDTTKFGNLEYERGVKDGIQHAKKLSLEAKQRAVRISF